jgi:hypothetical protein
MHTAAATATNTTSSSSSSSATEVTAEAVTAVQRKRSSQIACSVSILPQIHVQFAFRYRSGL